MTLKIGVMMLKIQICITGINLDFINGAIPRGYLHHWYLGPFEVRAKVPLWSGLCDMNDIVGDKNQYRRSLYAEYAVCLGHQLAGGHHPSCSKKNTWRAIPATARALSLRLNADDHNWWTTIPLKRHQQSGAEKNKTKKKLKTKPACHFQTE